LELQIGVRFAGDGKSGGCYSFSWYGTLENTFNSEGFHRKRAMTSYSTVIVFACVMAYCFAQTWRFNGTTFAIVKKLKLLRRVEGKEWFYMSDLPFRAKFYFRPTAILESGDSPSIRACKLELIEHRKKLWPHLFKIWLVMIGGVVLMVIVGVIEFMIRGNK
jgi:hypothetical protein